MSKIKSYIIDLRNNTGGKLGTYPLGISPLLTDSIVGYSLKNKKVIPHKIVNNVYYFGNEKVNEIKEVERLANIQFSQNYQQLLLESKNSILSANLMTWAQNKTPDLVLPLLNALQEAHFEQGNQLTSATDFDTIISTLKLSPPAKVFKHDKLSKDAMIQLEEIFALQEIINTQAIPALLLAVEDQLILLNHNFYLSEPKAIIEAVQLELNKYT